MKTPCYGYAYTMRTIVVLGLVFFATWLATGHSLTPEQELAKFFSGVYKYPKYNIFRCGDYFASGMGGPKRIAYLPKSLGSISRQVVGEFKVDNFRVLIDNTKDAPTAQIGGYLGGQVIVRISQLDFDRAPCLKHNSPQHK